MGFAHFFVTCRNNRSGGLGPTMKSEFLVAITQLAAEKNLPKEVVISAVEAALVSAFRKEDFAPHQNISVKLDSNTGRVGVWAEKTVVEQPSDPRHEMSLDEARRIRKDAQIDDVIEVEATPPNAGRIAAQTAKQVILQRLHEAEHSAIFEEYVNREGDIVTGVVQRIEPKQMFVDLGRTEAVLPAGEQVYNERYRVGQRLRVYLLEVVRTSKGPRVIVSRSHPNLLRRLFELEVPEVFNGTVELKAIAREAGYRSKVAVATGQEGIDPVGSCVGLRGIRIQNILHELNGEKLDVVMWDPIPTAFVANALSPAQVLDVRLNEEEGIATVVVPDRQLSLAIGKEGQNVRLAAKLTGWRIDIKSASNAEAERVAEMEPLPETMEEAGEEALLGEELPAEVPVIPETAELPAEGEEAEPLLALDTELIPLEVEPQVAEDKPQLRFAEDILVSKPPKPGVKTRKKKKGTHDRETSEAGGKVRKHRHSVEEENVEEEEY